MFERFFKIIDEMRFKEEEVMPIEKRLGIVNVEFAALNDHIVLMSNEERERSREAILNAQHVYHSTGLMWVERLLDLNQDVEREKANEPLTTSQPRKCRRSDGN